MQNFLFDRADVLGDIRSPVCIGPETIVRHAVSTATLEKVIGVCGKLSSDNFTETMTEAYRLGLSRFGDAWAYADITSLLYAVAELGQPENYLEIGVRRGRSSCMVGAASPQTTIYGFDLWQENYANNENPGPEFVRGELKRVGHAGRAEFISGDSHKTMPVFLSSNPNLTFDLITVDGDHSIEGAWDDLCNVVPRLRVGGVIAFDDIDNPYCPGLMSVWERFMKTFPGLKGQVVTNPLGLGVAFAIRMSKTDIAGINKSKKSGALWLRGR
jgi:predicted O-methyltransferase YrrM